MNVISDDFYIPLGTNISAFTRIASTPATSRPLRTASGGGLRPAVAAVRRVAGGAAHAGAKPGIASGSNAQACTAIRNYSSDRRPWRPPLIGSAGQGGAPVAAVPPRAVTRVGWRRRDVRAPVTEMYPDSPDGLACCRPGYNVVQRVCFEPFRQGVASDKVRAKEVEEKFSVYKNFSRIGTAVCYR